MRQPNKLKKLKIKSVATNRFIRVIHSKKYIDQDLIKSSVVRIYYDYEHSTAVRLGYKFHIH